MSTPQPLLKIKSKIIMNKILSNLIEIKKLKLIKYNKNIQKRLNININDYKECSSIELEIIFSETKHGQLLILIKVMKNIFIYMSIIKNIKKKKLIMK